jgi:heterodisulfide reductase subunit C
MNESVRAVRLEWDRAPGFAQELSALPGCEGLRGCIQCGTCSGVCPVAAHMDYSPRQLIELARSDFKNQVLRSRSIWLCASCYACTTACPREIRITDILYTLKQWAIREGVHPRRFTVPVLAREFSVMVRSRGRVTENFLASLVFFKTNWLAALGMWRLGLGLLKRGRFPLRLEGIKNRDSLRHMLDAAHAMELKEGTPGGGTRPTAGESPPARQEGHKL